jgi:hypothetical protein
MGSVALPGTSSRAQSVLTFFRPPLLVLNETEKVLKKMVALKGLFLVKRALLTRPLRPTLGSSLRGEKSSLSFMATFAATGTGAAAVRSARDKKSVTASSTVRNPADAVRLSNLEKEFRKLVVEEWHYVLKATLILRDVLPLCEAEGVNIDKIDLHNIEQCTIDEAALPQSALRRQLERQIVTNMRGVKRQFATSMPEATKPKKTRPKFGVGVEYLQSDMSSIADSREGVISKLAQALWRNIHLDEAQIEENIQPVDPENTACSVSLDLVFQSSKFGHKWGSRLPQFSAFVTAG